MFLSAKLKSRVERIVSEEWRNAKESLCSQPGVVTPEAVYRMSLGKTESRVNGLRHSMRVDSGRAPGSFITSLIISLMIKYAIKLLLQKLKMEIASEG